MAKVFWDYIFKKMGWCVYIMECADKSYYIGMARDVNKELKFLNEVHPDKHLNPIYGRLPLKIIYAEKNRPFREAFAKYSYLKTLNRVQRQKIIDTGKWHNSWQLYMRGYRSIPKIRGYS